MKKQFFLPDLTLFLKMMKMFEDDFLCEKYEQM